jgi:hypothetical protein
MNYTLAINHRNVKGGHPNKNALAGKTIAREEPCWYQ